MSKKTYKGEINKNTEWCGDRSTGNLPVCGQSIEDFLKSTLNSKFGCLWYDEANAKYVLFSDEADKELYISDPLTYPELKLAIFDAPEPYSISILFSSKENAYLLAGSKGNTIDFTFQTKDSSGSLLRESAQVVYSFNNSGNIQNLTKIYSADTAVSLNIDDYVTKGTNIITVTITGRSSGATKVYTLSLTLVELNLSSSFDITSPISEGSALPILYKISGLGTKFVEFYIDNEELPRATDSVADEIKEKTYYLPNTLEPGKHTLQIAAYVILEGNRFNSKTIYKEFTITGQEVSQKQIMIENIYESGIKLGPTQKAYIDAEQYVSVSVPWGFYNTSGNDGQVIWKTSQKLGEDQVKETTVQNITAQSGENKVYTLSFFPLEVGPQSLEAWIGSEKIAEYDLYVQENSSGLKETEDELALKLTALGRSNEEPEGEREVWADQGITTDFHNFAWNAQQGWDGKSLVINGGAWAEINYAPLGFAQKIVQTGATVEIEFETFNVNDPDAVLIEVYNKSTRTGIQITSTKASIISNGGVEVLTRFKDSERIKLAFIVNRNAGIEEACFTYIQNNGIIERCKIYDKTDDYFCPDHIILGNKDSAAGIKIYSIRCYKKALTIDEEFNNFIIDSDNLTKKISENDIYIPGTTTVSVEKMQGKLPVMLFTGPIGSVLMASNSKEVEIYADVDFTNPDDPTKNFTCTHARMKLQGTSSLGYPRKNFKLYTRSKYNAVMRDFEGKVIYNGLYAFKDGDVPVYTWTLKADFSDSSCTHNSTVARLYGDIEPSVLVESKYVLRTPPQKYALEDYKEKTGSDFPYKIRTTPNAMAMVCFYRETVEDDYIFLGQYNLLNDKGNEYVYGFHSIYNNPADPFYLFSSKDKTKILWDNSNVYCYEVLNNTNPLSLFINSDPEAWYTKLTKTLDKEDGSSETLYTGQYAWEEAFEARYPELDDPVVTSDGSDTTGVYAPRKEVAEPLRHFCEWIVGVNNSDDPQKKFEAEMEDHLDLYKLAAYYSYFMRFGAVDQVQKNMMWTTYDGQHWFPIRYDNDTILGLRNDLRLMFNYTIDRSTPDGEGYAYAGHDSLLWNTLEMSNEFMSIVAKVDQALYSAGLTYDNTCTYFDVTTSDRWCERIYNSNQKFKYIEPMIQGSDQDYTEALQGKRQSHRHWWLKNRFDIYDAKFLSGDYTDKRITWRGNTGTQFVNGLIRPEMNFICAKDSYYGWGTNKAVKQTGIKKSKGDSWIIAADQDFAAGDPVYIYGAPNLESVDLSDLMKFSSYVDLSGAYDEVLGSSLKSLNIGCKPGEENPESQFALSGLRLHTRLEYLNIRGLKYLNSLQGIENLINLKNLYAAGSGLSVFTCAEGCNFENIELPEEINTINVSKISWENLDYTITDELKSVTFTGMGSQENIKKFVLGWANYLVSEKGNTLWAGKSLTISDIHWADMTTAEVCLLKNFERLNIRGRIIISDMSRENYEKIKETFGPEVFDLSNNIVIDSAGDIFLDGPNNLIGGFDYSYSTTTFPLEYSGDTEYYIYDPDKREKVPVTTDDSGETISVYKNATLYVKTGELKTVEFSSNVSFYIVAENPNLPGYKSNDINIILPAIIYPESFSIDGPSVLDKKLADIPLYIKVFPESYNVLFKEIKVSLNEQNLDVTINKGDSYITTLTDPVGIDKDTLSEKYISLSTINGIPLSSKEYSLRIYGKTVKNNEVSLNYPITIKSVNPESIVITGPEVIDKLGDYTYQYEINPDYNVDLQEITVTQETYSSNITILERGIDKTKKTGWFRCNVSKIPREDELNTFKVVATTVHGIQVSQTFETTVLAYTPNLFEITNGKLDLGVVGNHSFDFKIYSLLKGGDKVLPNIPITSYSYEVPENDYLEITRSQGTHLEVNVLDIPEHEEDGRVPLKASLTTEYGDTLETNFVIRVRVLVEDFTIEGLQTTAVPDGKLDGKLKINYFPENFNVIPQPQSITIVKGTSTTVNPVSEYHEDTKSGIIYYHTELAKPEFTEDVSDEVIFEITLTKEDGSQIVKTFQTNFVYIDNPTSIITIRQDNNELLEGSTTIYRPISADDLVLPESDIRGGALRTIRNGSHHYIAKYDPETRVMNLCQLSDLDTTKYADTDERVPEIDKYDVFMKLPQFWYKGITYPGDPGKFSLVFTVVQPEDMGQSEDENDWKEWSGNTLIGAYKSVVKERNGKKVFRSISSIPDTIDHPTFGSSNPISNNNCREYGNNWGDPNFSCSNWEYASMMLALYLGWYGTPNRYVSLNLDDEKIKFVSMKLNSNSSLRPGEYTNFLGMRDGVTNDIGTRRMRFWGLEDFVGAGWDIIGNVLVRSVNSSTIVWTQNNEVSERTFFPNNSFLTQINLDNIFQFIPKNNQKQYSDLKYADSADEELHFYGRSLFEFCKYSANRTLRARQEFPFDMNSAAPEGTAYGYHTTRLIWSGSKELINIVSPEKFESL